MPDNYPRVLNLSAPEQARDPGDRFADAGEMGEELEAIVDQLKLPEFRVPAPRNSARRNSATRHPGKSDDRSTPPHPTRQLTLGPQDWTARDTEGSEDSDLRHRMTSRQFAGIEMGEFALARQHARRIVMIWLAAVLTLTGVVATVAWSFGSNLSELL